VKPYRIQDKLRGIGDGGKKGCNENLYSPPLEGIKPHAAKSFKAGLSKGHALKEMGTLGG